MTLHQLVKKAEKAARDNAPALLTGYGVAGTLATAYLTATATFKAAELIEYEESRPISDYVVPLEPKSKIHLTWKLYIPAAVVAGSTVTCIVMANRVGTRRTAAMAAAYTISDRAFTEYREKIVDKIGESKERTYRDEIAQERIDRNPPSSTIVMGNGEVLCYEPYTDRYFMSSMEELKAAQNAVNYKINNDCYASLTDFYDRVGLSKTAYSDEVGWNSMEQLELSISACVAADGRPALSVEYNATPQRDYYKVH